MVRDSSVVVRRTAWVTSDGSVARVILAFVAGGAGYGMHSRYS